MQEFLVALGLQWIGNMGTDLIRYAVFAVGVWLVLWVALSKILEHRKIRKEWPPARQLLAELGFSLRSVAIFSTLALIPFVFERLGWLTGPAVGASWGPLWFWLSFTLMVVAHDAYFYWVHHMIHDPRLFRRFHRRHHLSNNPSPFTAYSFDIGEAALNGLFVPIWVFLVPTPWAAVGLFVVHQIARNTLGHSGYELFPARRDGRPLFDFLTTTTHHDLHHAQAGYNYGLYFTWWDRWMKTEHPHYHARFAKAVGKEVTESNAAHAA